MPSTKKTKSAKPHASLETEAVAYMRTSSSANVGDDKDSEARQWSTISNYAKQHGYSIRDEARFYDAAVSGGNDLESRPQLKAMQAYCAKHGVNVIIVEDSSRFARDLIIQERGYQQLTQAGYTLIAAKHPHQFTDTGPTATLMRQILGAINEFDKHMIVARLKSGRDKKVAAAKTRTLSGRGKACGMKSRLEGPDGATIRKVLMPYARKRKLATGDPLEASVRLQTEGIRTKSEKPLTKWQVTRYIGAMKIELGETKRSQGGSSFT